MATKQTKSNIRKPKDTPTKQQPATKEKDPLFRYILAVVIFFIAIILIISAISYFFTWQEDQSISSWSSFKIKAPNEALNMGGRFGAVFSRIFIDDWFGVFGILMPIIMIIISGILLKVRTSLLYKSFVSTTLLMFVGSISATYFFPEYNGIFGSSLGGAVGYYFNNYLGEIFGYVGEGVILFMFMTIILLYISKDIFIRIYSFFVILDGLFKLMYNKFSASRPKPVAKNKPIEQRIGPDSTISEPTNANYNNNQTFTPPIVGTLGEAATREAIIENPREGITLNDLYAKIEQNAIYNSEGIPTPAAYKLEDNGEETVLGSFDEDYPQQEGFTENFEENYPQQEIPNEEEGLIDDNIYEDDQENFTVTPTIIPPGVTHFNAEAPATTAATASNDAIPFEMDRDDLVVFKSKIFDDIPSEETDTDNMMFETYTLEKHEETNQPIPEEPKPTPTKQETLTAVKQETESAAIATPPQSTSQYPKEDSFVIERTTRNDDFEISITDNADIDVGDNVDTKSIKTNFNEEASDIDTSVYDPTRELSRYKLPTIELMDNHTRRVTVTEEELFENKAKIVETLENFNIKIDKIKATIGPTVTLYEINPAPGVRISKIKNLEDDIALSLSALGIRIIAPIPGKGTIGIEVPNKDKEIVSMYSVIKGAKFQESDADLPIVLGRTIQNEDYVIDLAKTPHMLVAGATGQGKSVGLNAIITSLLYKKHPAELKFVFVDPKKVELTLYANLERHFLAKLPGEDEAIITDTQKVVFTLNSMCSLMDSRYTILKSAKVRNIKEYNAKFTSRVLNPNNGHHFMPYFVVIIDEFADLIMTAGREIETPIARLAQLGRATGIHLVIATQRPTTNIITGVIKANFPTRIAFRVSSMIDSRTILDQPGANQLIGRGDMLISNGNDTTRVQCAFIDTPEVERITEFIGKQTGYGEAYELPEYVPEGKDDKDMEVSGSITLRKDGLFDEVARYVVTAQQGSASTIQRNFSIGFNRAGRIMDQLEKAGIVGRQEGSKPRQVLVSDISTLEVILYDMENR